MILDDEGNFNPIGCLGLIVLIILGFFALWFLGILMGIASLPFQAASNTVSTVSGVMQKTMNADNAMTNYRWFHDASASLDLYPTKIRNAAGLEKWSENHAPDRAMARQTELTGLEQTCLGLVGDYNSRAARIDSGFFRNPERYLPVSSSAWAPLPPSYPQNWCDTTQGSQQ